MRHADGGLRVDPKVIREHSGGQRRVLTLAAVLVDEQPVNIVEVARAVAGVDCDVLALVLANLSYAGAGADGNVMTVRVGPGKRRLVDVGPVVRHLR